MGAVRWYTVAARLLQNGAFEIFDVAVFRSFLSFILGSWLSHAFVTSDPVRTHLFLLYVIYCDKRFFCEWYSAVKSV